MAMLVYRRVTSQLSPPFFTSSSPGLLIQGTRHHSTGMVAQRRHPHWTVSFEKKEKKRKKWDGMIFFGMETNKKSEDLKFFPECFLENLQKFHHLKAFFRIDGLCFFLGGAYMNSEQEITNINVPKINMSKINGWNMYFLLQ